MIQAGQPGDPSGTETAAGIATMGYASVPTSTSETADRHHDVQYYKKSQVLVRRVVDFFVPAFAAGEAVILIATPKHCDLVEAELRDRGIDIDAVNRAGSYLALDAFDTLRQFMEGDRLDSAKFWGVIGTAVERTRSRAKVPTVRAFGEMVALLWKQGRPNAALALEDAWNDLIGVRPLSLLCGYPSAGLLDSDLAAITARHTA